MHPGLVEMYHDGPILLLARAEERCSQHCVKMSCLSLGQDQAPEIGRLLQHLAPPEWKCDCITFEIVPHLPTSHCQIDTMSVIVDHLVKSVHFIPSRQPILCLS